MLGICKCGIAALDCTYHRPDPWEIGKRICPSLEGDRLYLTSLRVLNFHGAPREEWKNTVRALVGSGDITFDEGDEAMRELNKCFLSVTPGEAYITVSNLCAGYYYLACDVPGYTTRITF